jgi:hypothetical protein
MTGSPADKMDFDASKSKQDAQDEALMKLHDLLAAKNAGSFGNLDADQRRKYFAEASRKSRAKVRSAEASGAPAATSGVVRDVLADAAIMILATDAPGAEHIRAVLSSYYSKRPGVPLMIETKAKGGKLRTKLIARSEG